MAIHDQAVLDQLRQFALPPEAANLSEQKQVLKNIETVERAMDNFFFHGSGAKVGEVMDFKNSDSILWCSRSPSVAQFFIPPGILKPSAADHNLWGQRTGSLLIIEKLDDMKWMRIHEDAFASTRKGAVGSGLIPTLQSSGFDGVIAKETVMDSIGRRIEVESWGLLPKTGLQKVRYAKIEATHHEWAILAKVDEATMAFYNIHKAMTTPVAAEEVKPKRSFAGPGI